MSWVARLYRSSLGAKYVMALTGALLFLFLIAHLLGNLQVFAGADAVNSYAEKLRHLGPLLWVARIGLLVLAGLHVVTALRVARANDAARPVPYAKSAHRAVKAQTKTMVLSGLVILAYVVYHLAHFTWGFVQHENSILMEKVDGGERHDVFSMIVLSFQCWWVAASYLVAMALLAMHLCHGLSSLFQTFGFHHSKYACAVKLIGPAVATLIFLGYASIPVACWLGIVQIAEGS